MKDVSSYLPMSVGILQEIDIGKNMFNSFAVFLMTLMVSTMSFAQSYNTDDNQDETMVAALRIRSSSSSSKSSRVSTPSHSTYKSVYTSSSSSTKSSSSSSSTVKISSSSVESSFQKPVAKTSTVTSTSSDKPSTSTVQKPVAKASTASPSSSEKASVAPVQSSTISPTVKTVATAAGVAGLTSVVLSNTMNKQPEKEETKTEVPSVDVEPLSIKVEDASGKANGMYSGYSNPVLNPATAPLFRPNLSSDAGVVAKTTSNSSSGGGCENLNSGSFSFLSVFALSLAFLSRKNKKRYDYLQDRSW